MNNSAKKIDFPQDENAINIQTIVENSRLTGGYQRVPLHLLTVPRYQRSERQKVPAIAKEWNDLKCDPLMVSYRDGKLYVVDGRQRLAAAYLIGKTNLMCRIVEGLTERDEVDVYRTQNKNKVRQVPYDILMTDVALGDDPGTAIVRICKENDVTLSQSIRAKIGECGCVATLTTIYQESGEDGLNWIFDVVRSLGWNCVRNGYKKILMSAFRYMYTTHKNHEAVKTAIMKRCEGKMPDDVILEAQGMYGRTDNNVVLMMLQKDCKGIK